MKIVHLLYPDESGCIYCKKINGLIKIVPMKTPCLDCERMIGTIQGAGIECAWNDFDFSEQVAAVYDPLAEYDRVNNFKKIPTEMRLKVWNLRNRVAQAHYQEKIAAQYAAPLPDEDSPQRKKLIEEVLEYCERFKDYGLEPPMDFPCVTDEEMEDWLFTWSEFEPYPEDE